MARAPWCCMLLTLTSSSNNYSRTSSSSTDAKGMDTHTRTKIWPGSNGSGFGSGTGFWQRLRFRGRCCRLMLLLMFISRRWTIFDWLQIEVCLLPACCLSVVLVSLLAKSEQKAESGLRELSKEREDRPKESGTKQRS